MPDIARFAEQLDIQVYAGFEKIYAVGKLENSS